jgi:predicted HicB family RNase H-like nuclease
MQKKLTLRIDENLIEKAKRFSEKNGKSVSKIVSDYLENIHRQTLKIPP